MASFKRLTEDQRKAIGRLGWSHPNVSQLARDYHVKRDTINTWLEVGRQTTPNYSDKPRSGRPKVTDQAMKNKMRRLARARKTARQIQGRFVKQHGLRISQSSIRRVLRSGKHPMCWLRIRRGKKLRPMNIRKRLAFCQQHLEDATKRWVFIDAKDCYCYYDAAGTARWSWQSMDQEPAVELSNPWVYRVYAAVSHGHKSSLVFVPPSPPVDTRLHKAREGYTAGEYVAMMRIFTILGATMRSWFPTGRYHIIQDSARQHTAKASVKTVAEMGLPIMADFPPKSLGLNIIENTWGVLDANLLGVVSKSNAAWRAEICRAWEQVQQSTIDALVAGMRERMEKVIEAGGHWVKHH